MVFKFIFLNKLIQCNKYYIRTMAVIKDNTLIQSLFPNSDLQNYLQSELNDNYEKFASWLTSPPQFTTLRLNTLRETKFDLIFKIQTFLNKENGEGRYSVREHPSIPDLVYIHSNSASIQLQPSDKQVIVRVQCAEAVLRGANVFTPGVLAAPPSMQIGDTVSVYADLEGKCLRGLKKCFNGRKFFVGNGVAKKSRAEVFKTPAAPSGIVVEITERIFSSPPLNNCLRDAIFLQNLPSIVVGHVMNPQPGETILDMCAAPGGKTSHLACLMENKGRIFACDKAISRVQRIKDLADLWNLKCITPLCYDATLLVKALIQRRDNNKLSLERQTVHNNVNIIAESSSFVDVRPNDHAHEIERIKVAAADANSNDGVIISRKRKHNSAVLPPLNDDFPECFDRILLDAPCSALGQRPRLVYGQNIKEVKSYPPQQRRLFETAVELLKPGGVLVYSTCSISRDENEAIVAWALKTFPHIRLAPQKIVVAAPGMHHAELSEENRLLLQRFQGFEPETFASKEPVDCDTIGFFIAKFIKNDCVR